MSFPNFLTTYKRFPLRLILVLLFGFSSVSKAQDSLKSAPFFEPSEHLIKSRRNAVLLGEGVGGVGLLGALSYTWYSSYNTSKFHLFNDADEWLGMDKIGHGLTSFYIAQYTSEMCKWAGLPKRQQTRMGLLYSFAFLTSVEVLDGFSDGWGFSLTDMGANLAGLGFFLINKQVFKEDRIVLKYNVLTSPYRVYRPALLGDNFFSSMIKDYNAQTYWLSINLANISGWDRVPSWLGVGIGYGAEGLLGGKKNPEVNEAGQVLPEFLRYSQFYLSPDIQWEKIKTKNKYLKTLLKALSFYKLPLPGLEYNGKGEILFNWLI